MQKYDWQRLCETNTIGLERVCSVLPFLVGSQMTDELTLEPIAATQDKTVGIAGMQSSLLCSTLGCARPVAGCSRAAHPQLTKQAPGHSRSQPFYL